MKRTYVAQYLMCVVMLVVLTPPVLAVDLPSEAFGLLAQAAVEPCAICAEQQRKKALAIMQRVFVPGRELTTDAACRLVKAGQGVEQELTLTCYPPAVLMETLPEGARPPRLAFTFHTRAKHLVGIAQNDFTDAALAATYHAAPSGTIFEGKIRYTTYKYGDGPAFNFSPKTNTLQVHCVLVRINPVKH